MPWRSAPWRHRHCASLSPAIRWMTANPFTRWIPASGRATTRRPVLDGDITSPRPDSRPESPSSRAGHTPGWRSSALRMTAAALKGLHQIVTSDHAKFERAGHTQKIVPMASNEVGVDAMASHANEGPVGSAWVDAIEAGVAEIREPWAEAITKQHEQTKDDVRIRCRVGDQGRRPQRGVLLEQSVDNDHRVAQGARHHKAEESDAASRCVVHVRHAFAAAEVPGIASRMDRADRHDEPQAVGGC